jgi:hypothetical protein
MEILPGKAYCLNFRYRQPRSLHECLKEEKMLSKRLLPIILIAAVLILTVSSIPMAMGLATEGDYRSDESSPINTQAVAFYLNQEIRISDPTNPESERYVPAVAYNSLHNEYLVVWYNEWPGGGRDIYARRVSASGKLLSWFAVSAGSNVRALPDVVYNAAQDEYLIVWMYNANGDGKTYEIWGRTVAWNGAYQNPEFLIFTWANRSFWTPKVAWNSVRNEYIVVWDAFNTITSEPNDISFEILSANGTSRHVGFVTNTDFPHQADVAFNAAKDEYLVVWRRMQAPADGDIMAVRISGGPGTIVNPPGVITVSNTAQDQRRPAVATNQHNRYVVVWEHAFPGPCCDWDIKSRELDNNGNLLGSEGLVVGSTEDETSPAVAARYGSGWEYLVAFQQHRAGDEQVWAIHKSPSGTTGFEVATAAFWDHETPAVAMGRVSSLVTYSGDTGGDPNIHRHIYARRYIPNSVYLPLTLYR